MGQKERLNRSIDTPNSEREVRHGKYRAWVDGIMGQGHCQSPFCATPDEYHFNGGVRKVQKDGAYICRNCATI